MIYMIYVQFGLRKNTNLSVQLTITITTPLHTTPPVKQCLLGKQAQCNAIKPRQNAVARFTSTG